MNPHGAPHPQYVQLTSAYWLDSPDRCSALCACSLDSQPPRPHSGPVVRYALLGLASAAIIAALALVGLR